MWIRYPALVLKAKAILHNLAVLYLPQLYRSRCFAWNSYMPKAKLPGPRRSGQSGERRNSPDASILNRWRRALPLVQIGYNFTEWLDRRGGAGRRQNAITAGDDPGSSFGPKQRRTSSSAARGGRMERRLVRPRSPAPSGSVACADIADGQVLTALRLACPKNYFAGLSHSTTLPQNALAPPV